MVHASATVVAAMQGARRPLGELVTEINTCLAIPDDAASMQQSSDGSGGASRVRVALPLLFDHLESDHGALLRCVSCCCPADCLRTHMHTMCMCQVVSASVIEPVE
jgi:hypothetical protein